MRFLVFLSVILFSYLATAACVVSAKANLRSGPGMKHPITWQVNQYMPLKVMEAVGNWVKVMDVDSQIHYTHRSTLSDKVRCVVVKVIATNLRKGPGGKFPKADFAIADKYTTFRSLGGENGWVLVEDSFGNQGWVFLDNLWKPRTYVMLDFE